MKALRFIGRGVCFIASILFAGILLIWNFIMNIVGILLCAITD